MALTVSAHDRLGQRRLLAVPYHIAGLAVLVRSVDRRTVPVELNVSAGFDVTELPNAIKRH